MALVNLPLGNLMKAAAALSLLVLAAMAPAQINQKAEQILQQLKAAQNPAFDQERASDEAYQKEHRAAVKQAIRKRAGLVIQLFREDPEHPALFEYLPKRWAELEQLADNEEELISLFQQGIKETEDLLIPPPNISDATIWPQDDWHQMLRYNRALMVIKSNRGNWPAMFGVVKDYIQEVPAYPSTHPELILQAAFRAPAPQQAAEGYRLIVENYPRDPLTPTVAGLLMRIDGVGRPFSLKVTDLKTKKEVNTESWKGKVVLIDFYSFTAPGLNERVKLISELKQEFGSKGLEILSICVDRVNGPAIQPLEERNLAWISEEKISWPVAVAGASAQDRYITPFGLRALPDPFLIDREGRLVKLGYGLDLKKEISDLFKP